MFRRSHAPFAYIAVAVLVTACAATGPMLSAVQASIPALEQGQGRLFFYREYATFGSGMQPDIFVCGKKVGESVPGGVFYVDLPAGQCEVSIPAIVFKGQTRIKVNIGSPAVQYLRTGVGSAGFEGFTNVELVTASVAMPQMQGLALMNPSR